MPNHLHRMPQNFGPGHYRLKLGVVETKNPAYGFTSEKRAVNFNKEEKANSSESLSPCSRSKPHINLKSDLNLPMLHKPSPVNLDDLVHRRANYSLKPANLRIRQSVQIE
jgi:hypothetical protein